MVLFQFVFTILGSKPEQIFKGANTIHTCVLPIDLLFVIDNKTEITT